MKIKPHHLIAFLLIGQFSYHILKIGFGPAAINTQLLASLALFLCAAYYAITKQSAIQPPHKSTLLAFTLYTGIASLSILYTSQKFNVEVVGLWITLATATSISLTLKFNKDIYSLKRTSNLIIYLGAMQATLGLLQFIFNHPIVPKDHSLEWEMRGMNRISGTYRDPFDFGFYLSICLILLLFNFFSAPLIRKYKHGLTFYFLTAILLAQSFTNILGLLLAAGLYFTFSDARKKLQFTKKTIYASLAALPIALSLSFLFSDKVGALTDTIDSRLEQYSSSEDESRSVHLKAGYEMMLDSGLLGFGYGSYDSTSPNYVKADTFVGLKYINKFKSSTNPTMTSHSLPGTTMGELGIIGLIALCALLISIAIPPSEGQKHNRTYMILYGCVFCLILTRLIFYGFRISDTFLFFIILYFRMIASLSPSNEKP